MANGFVTFTPKFNEFKDKKANANDYVMNMLAKTNRMFKYNGLPETIPARNLEFMLQTKGHVFVTEAKGDLYSFIGGPGGEPNAYYMPTTYIIANPYLDFNKTCKIDVDGVVIPSDSMYVGLIPILSRYASLISETDLSMRIGLINTRIVSLITGGTDKGYKAATKYLKDIEDGKLGAIGDQSFWQSINTQPYASGAHTDALKNLMEVRQYLYGTMLHEVGINAPFNMKREAINSSEAGLNDDALLPLIDDMLNCRKEALEKINKMFGTNISVELNGVWADTEKENEAQLEIMEKEIEDEPQEEPKEDPENEEKEEKDNEDQ